MEYSLENLEKIVNLSVEDAVNFARTSLEKSGYEADEMTITALTSFLKARIPRAILFPQLYKYNEGIFTPDYNFANVQSYWDKVAEHLSQITDMDFTITYFKYSPERKSRNITIALDGKPYITLFQSWLNQGNGLRPQTHFKINDPDSLVKDQRLTNRVWPDPQEYALDLADYVIKVCRK